MLSLFFAQTPPPPPSKKALHPTKKMK
uniref:Uncharacterized protein n=2 Tax=Anguilla anguilla TaxID=7936 RepID=A0A0E9S9R6_ANGAN